MTEKKKGYIPKENLHAVIIENEANDKAIIQVYEDIKKLIREKEGDDSL